MKSPIHSLIALLFLSISVHGFVAKPQQHKDFELINDFIMETQVKGNMRIEDHSGIPRAIYSPDYPVSPGSPESMARQYLQEKAELLGHDILANDIKFIHSVETPAGYRVQFNQERGGYNVYSGSVKISLNRNHEVVFVTNGYQQLGKMDLNYTLSQDDALSIAKSHLKTTGPPSFEAVETVIYMQNRIKATLAHKINIVPGKDLNGDWEILVDASSGEILRAEDKACYYDGSGWVYDPDPLSAAAALYGEGEFSDNSDMNNDSLEAYLKQVTLENITVDNGRYSLTGPYASIIDGEEPYTGLYIRDSSDFHFTRDMEEFEAVNIYYHLNQSMAYINDSLGFDIMPFQYPGGVQFDPHGLNGDQNAHFLPSTGWVAFGSPTSYVDAGEDHAIVIHELGHGLHSWITMGSLSQVDGLSEGLSDYWAQSYTRSLGLFHPGDEHYDYFGLWGLQPFGVPTLRVTNFPNHYPDELGGEVHYDGQLWSSSLMSIYDIIGRTATDIDVWEAISMTDASSNQVDAAFAFIQADRDVYNAEHLSDILTVFHNRGYIAGPVMARFTSDINAGEGPLTVSFQDLSLGFPDAISSWQWDFDSDGIIDSDLPNPTYIFTEPGTYSVTQIVSNDAASDTLIENAYISVNSGILVFEGVENGQDYSGTFIKNELEALNLEVNYANRFPSSLQGFEAVFVSLGNLGGSQSPGTVLVDENLDAILDYASNDGNIYIEGGSLMALLDYFSYSNRDSLWSAFGVEFAYLSEENHPMLSLTGENNSLASGLSFSNSTQSNNIFLDYFDANSEGVVAFTEPFLGNVAIQNEGDMGQHTFHFTYSLSDLVDGNGQNTRRNIILNLLSFFQTPILIPEFSASSYSGHAPLELLFSDVSTGYPEATSWQWDFNDDGVIDSEEQHPIWVYSEPGEYSVKLVVGNGSITDSTTFESAIHVFDGESAINFKDARDVVLIPANDILNITQDLTIESWIYPTAWGDQNTGDARIVDKTFIRLFLNKTGSSQFADSSLGLLLKHQDGTLSKIGTTPHSIVLNEWQHIAVSYSADSSDVHLIVNGIDRTLIDTAPSGPIMNHSIWAMYVGNNNTRSSVFEGRIDELRIWNTARDLEDMIPTMSDYLTGDEAGLVGYWRMNEATGDTLYDMTSNHLNAAIENSSWGWGTTFVVPVGIDDHQAIPVERLIVSNYPNPFNPTTTLRYGLPSATTVEIDIFNIQGQLVRSFSLNGQPAGWHELTWNGLNSSGQVVNTGIYFCRIQTDHDFISTKMLMLK